VLGLLWLYMIIIIIIQYTQPVLLSMPTYACG
jgi:hypothetical protein